MVIDIAAAALPNLGAVYPKMLSAVREPWRERTGRKKSSDVRVRNVVIAVDHWRLMM